MSALTEFEPFVDTTIRTFFSRLDEFVVQKKVCDIALWLQYCESLMRFQRSHPLRLSRRI